MINPAITKATFAFLLSCHPALADDIEDAYKKGVEAGWSAGYQQGLRDAPTMMAEGAGGSDGSSGGVGVPGSTFNQRDGKFVFGGTRFKTTIDATGQYAPFSFPSDSSVAIIPKKSLDEIQQKLGNEFLQNDMILNQAPGG